MLTFAVPVDTTLNILDVKSDDGFMPVPPEPAPDTENSPANEVFDPFTHETDPVLDGGVLDTDMLVAGEGNKVVLETDIEDMVGGAKGVTLLDADDSAERPFAFLADTVNVYAVRLVSPVTTTSSALAVAVIPPGIDVAL
jgi:hypothetical protein